MNNNNGSYIYFNQLTKENNLLVYTKSSMQNNINMFPLQREIIEKEKHDYIFNIYLVQNKNIIKKEYSGTHTTIVKFINEKKAINSAGGYEKIKKLLTIEKNDFEIYSKLKVNN